LGPVSFHGLAGGRPGSGSPRVRRRCLLKGCERPFIPARPQARYCSVGCRLKARRWRRWQASQRYRASSHGQERRREQQRRYRQRRRQRIQSTTADAPAPREGQRPACANEDSRRRYCDRPGCYVVFVVAHAHCCQRFCSIACRLALRRVLDREARYRQRRRRWRRQGGRQRGKRPDTS